MSGLMFGSSHGLVPDEAMKSRYACAEQRCDHGASTGYAIHRVSTDGERFKGYCADHLGDRTCLSANHACDREVAS